MSRLSGELDERAVAIENAAGRQAYLVMSWLLVADLLLRARFPDWTTFNGMPVDILAVLTGGALTWFWYNWRAGTFTNRRVLQMGLSALAGAVVAGVLAWFVL